mmetsp:Transcript_20606/g.28533  ORF Transcript_20606/g.28533 Transcript_20606/m.28533 type:complete len:168 (-) Transcript_20606:528-1031(-)
MMRTLGLWESPADILVVFLNCYFVFSCVFIESNYCWDPLISTDTRFMMPETYKYVREYNPYFLSRPEWLRVATCFSASGFVWGYFMILIGFLFRLNIFRVPILLFLGMKFYAIVFYHVMEFNSDLPPPSLLNYWGPEAPYLLSLALVLFRMSKHMPFSVATVSFKQA